MKNLVQREQSEHYGKIIGTEMTYCAHYLFLVVTLSVCLALPAAAAEQTPIVTFDGHSAEIYSVAFSPDGRYVLTGGGKRDSSAELWDALTGQVVQSFEHPTSVTSVAFSPDGSTIATISPSYLAEDSGSVYLWKVETGELITTLPHDASVLSFSPDGEQIVTAGGGVKFWDAQSLQLMDTVSLPRGREMALAYSPDAARLLVGCIDWISWDSSSGASDPGGSTEVAYLLRMDTKEIIASYDEFGHCFGRPVAYSPEGSFYAMRSDGYPRSVRVFDASTLLSVTSVGGTSAQSLAFSPDGSKLLVGMSGGEAKLYCIRPALGRLRTFRGHAEWCGITAVAYSRDGTRIVTAGTDHKAYVWDVSDLVTGVTDWAKR